MLKGCLTKHKIITIDVLIASNIKSLDWILSDEKLYPRTWTITIDGNRTNRIFIILLPIIFPIPIAAFFFIAAIITVISSGREVPRAKIVKPITVCAIPMLVKNANDSDKNNLPPIKKPKKLNVNLIKFISLACFSSEISTLDEKFF